MGILGIELLRVGELCLGHGLQGPLLPLPGSELGVEEQTLLHLGSDAHEGVQTGHGLLKDHRQIAALDLAELSLTALEELLPRQGDAPPHLHQPPGQQAADAHGGDGLAAARLPHQAQNLPLVQGEGDPVHGAAALPGPEEADVQVVDTQKRSHGHTSLPCWARRWSPSLRRLKPRIRRAMVPPTLRAYQGALFR